ncbi:hypothetical protein CPB97_010173 [Podila verticillata]|nr:hypothetical protein CPB97_010173 [Podila verticillata]
MEAAHPALKVAEIRTQIGENLVYYPPGSPYHFNRSPLLACMQVCKEWAGTFRPLVWRKMFFSQREAHKLNKELVLKNGHHIRSLIIRDVTLLLHGWFDNCTQLTFLQFEPTMSQRRQLWASPVLRNTLPAADGPDMDLDFLSPDSIDILRALIDRNPNLTGLGEYWANLSPQQVTLFQNSLCNHHNHLSRIHLMHWESTVAEIQMVIDNSPKLRELSFCYGTLHELTPPSTTPRITSPTIHFHAPELTTYKWSGFVGSTRFSTTEPIATSFLACSTWYCPQLSSFRLNLETHHILQGMPRMLETAERLEDITFHRCAMSDEFLETLVHKHSLSLRKVNLRETKGVSSTSIRLILSTCTSLVLFRGPHEALHASDWIKAPWVCHKLRFLSVFLDFSGLGPVYVPPPGPETDVPVFRNPYTTPAQDRVTMSEAQAQEIYSVIYNQLSQLSELCSIDFGGLSNGKKYIMGVPWTLKSGLAKLSTLKKLDEIYVTESVREIGVEEAQWMKANWPRLKTVWRQDDTSLVVTEAAFAKVEREFMPKVRVAIDTSGGEFPL